MTINSVLSNDYINNSSDILSLSKNNEFKKLIDKVDKNKIIKVDSHLIHKKDISGLEQFVFNLDNYISFLKFNLLINQLEIRIILDLTIYNNNNILFSDIYFYDNKDFYIEEYKKMFMYKYLKNYNILNKYINIKKLSFDELIIKLNQNKNKAHFYFEDINKNLPYYITIIDYLENTSNIWL